MELEQELEQEQEREQELEQEQELEREQELEQEQEREREQEIGPMSASREYPWLPIEFCREIDNGALSLMHNTPDDGRESDFRAGLVGGYLKCLRDLEAAQSGNESIRRGIIDVMRACMAKGL